MAGNQVTGDGLSVNLAGMSKNQLYDIMSQMKTLIDQNQDQARQILIQNPLLTKALFQAQIMLGMLQPPQEIPKIQPAGTQHPTHQATPPAQQSTGQNTPLAGQSNLRDQTSAPIPTSSISPSNPSLPSHPLQPIQLGRSHMNTQSAPTLPSPQSSNMGALPLHYSTPSPSVIQPTMPPVSTPLQQPLHISSMSHLPLQPPLPPQPRPSSMPPAFPHQNYPHMGPNTGFQHQGAPQMHHSQPMFHSGSRPPTSMAPPFSQGPPPLPNQQLSQTLYQSSSLLDYMQEADECLAHVVKMSIEEEEQAREIDEKEAEGCRHGEGFAKRREREMKETQEARAAHEAKRAAEVNLREEAIERALAEVVRKFAAERGKKTAASTSALGVDDMVGGSGGVGTGEDAGGDVGGGFTAFESAEAAGGLGKKRKEHASEGSSDQGHQKKKKKSTRSSGQAYSSRTRMPNPLNSKPAAARLGEALEAENVEAEHWVPRFKLPDDFDGESVNDRREFFDFVLPAKKLNQVTRVPILELMDEADSNLMDFLTTYHCMRHCLANARKAVSEHWTREEDLEKRLATLTQLNERMEKYQAAALEASSKLDEVKAEAAARVKAAEERAAAEIERVRAEMTAALEGEMKAKEAAQVEVKRQANDAAALKSQLVVAETERNYLIGRLKGIKESYQELSDTCNSLHCAALVSGIPDLVGKMRKSNQFPKPHAAIYDVAVRLGHHQACLRIKEAMPELPDQVFGNMIAEMTKESCFLQIIAGFFESSLGGGSHAGMDFNQMGISTQPERGSTWMPENATGTGTLLSGASPPFLPQHTPRPASLTADMEKALLQQVMSLTPEQINLLPPDQRNQVLQLQQMLRQ